MMRLLLAAALLAGGCGGPPPRPPPVYCPACICYKGARETCAPFVNLYCGMTLADATKDAGEKCAGLADTCVCR